MWKWGGEKEPLWFFTAVYICNGVQSGQFIHDAYVIHAKDGWVVFEDLYRLNWNSL